MRSIPVTLILIPFLLAAACDRPPSEFGVARRLSKAERPTVWDAPTKERLGVVEMGPAQSDETGYVGDTPAGWEERAPRRFRDLVWGVVGEPEIECWLTAGVGGGVAGNLTRWYGQFGQPPGSHDSLPEVTLAGEPGRLLELSGTYDGRPGTTMIVVFKSRGRQVTSIKIVGPIEAVKANRDKFLTLAASLRAEDVAARTGTAGNSGSGQAPTGGDSQNDLTGEQFLATAPSSWTRSVQSSKPLHHTFGTDGEVYVSQLTGDIRPMLGIWRGEVGLREPLTEEEFAALPTCTMLGAGALWFDLAGDYTSMSGKRIANARIIVVVRNDGGTITFAKMVGGANDVAAEAEAFRAFCGSLRRHQ